MSWKFDPADSILSFQNCSTSSKFEEKFEEINGDEATCEVASAPASSEDPNIATEADESRGKEIDVQAQLVNEQCPVAVTTSDGPSGMTKIVPSSDDVSALNILRIPQKKRK